MQKADAQPDVNVGPLLSAGLFYYVCECLAGGIPVQQLCDLYREHAHAMNADRNSRTKIVVRQLHDLAVGAAE